jgi:hypothetical protein
MATVSPQFIIEGLKRRGYPEHVAQGFVMNMMDESGLNPGINEAAPIVPGSRGGFGLYQLTGPRRTAYEQFAAQRGVNPADAEAQLDFLDYELKGPESRAAKSILSTQNPQQAAVAIARDFLRPATEHLNRRVARYSGADVAADTMAALGKGGGTVTPDQIAQGAMAQSAGQEPEQPRGLLGNLFGNPDTMAALAMAFNSMRLNPDPNLSAVLSAQMKERRGERKETAQLNKTLAYLEKQAAAGDPRAAAALDYAKGTGDIANALKIATEKAPKASEAEQKINRLMADYGVDRKTAVGIVDGVVVVNRDPVTGQAQLVNKVTGDVVGSPSGGTGQITETALPTVEASDTFADTNVSGALGARGFGASVLNTVTDAVGLGQWADETGKAQQALQNLSARTMLGLSAEFPGRPSNLTRERIEAMTVMPGEITTGPDKALNKTREMRKLLEQSYAAASSAASGQGRYSPTQVAEARQNIGQIESLLADYIALEEALTKGLGGSQPSAQTGGGTSGSVSVGGKNIPWKIKE